MSDQSDFVIENGVLKKYVGPGGDVVVPDGVTEIGISAFFRSKATKITLPDTVINIAEEAFRSCRTLESIRLSESLRSVGEMAFRYCTSLTELVFPQSAEMGDPLLIVAECHKLERLVMPTSAGFKKTVTRKLFSLWGAYSVKSIVYPSLVIQEITPDLRLAAVRGFTEYPERFTSQEVIDSYITYMVRQKKNVFPIIFEKDNAEMLERVLNASKSAIKDAEELISIAQNAGAVQCAALLLDRFQTVRKKAPELSLKDDSHNASEIKKKWAYTKNDDGAYTLTSYKGDDTKILVPGRVGGITVSALGLCIFSPKRGKDYKWNTDRKPQNRYFVMINIEEVSIEDGLQRIGVAAFYDCSKLKRVIMPDSITEIDKDAFGKCTKMKKIELPKRLKTLDASAFDGCEKLTEITVNNDNPYFTSVNGVLFSKDMKELTAYPPGKKDELFTLPETVEKIGNGAFSSGKYLKDIYIPLSVTAMDNCFGWYLRPTVHAPAGSYAEQYAKEHNIPFVAEA